MRSFEFLIDSQSNTPPVISFSLSCSPDKEAMKKLRMTFKSQDTAIARSVEIKAGQDVLHLFIVPPVLGVELQNEVFEHLEALGIGGQNLRTLSITPDNKEELIIVHTR